MSDDSRPRGANVLVVLCALLALGGLAVLAGGTVMFAELGRSPARADAEGPGITAKAQAVVEAFAANLTAARAKAATAKEGYQALGPNATDAERLALRQTMSDAAAEQSEAKRAAEQELQNLRANAGEPIQCIGVIGRRPGGKLVLELRAGEFSSFGPLATNTVSGTAVERIAAQGHERGLLIFRAAPATTPPGNSWSVIVVYGGIRLIEPGWGPLRSAASWNAAGLFLLLIGGFGLYFAIRRLRRVRYEAGVAA